MTHNTLDLKNYKIHHYQTDRFKTIYISVSLRKPIKKEEITKNKILFSVLFAGTKNYRSDIELNIAKEDLYNARILNNDNRFGNYYHTYMDLVVLEDTYTEKNNLDKSISLMSEIILNPNIENNSFDKNIVEREKKILRDYLESIKDNPMQYAFIKAKEFYDDKSPSSFRTIGYIEDIDKINEHNLYEYYLDLFKNNIIDIYVVGNISLNETKKLIQKHFIDLKEIKIKNKDYYLNNKSKNKVKTKKEVIDNKQSQVIVMYKADKLNYKERNYVLPILSEIIGGDPSSKLFTTIREKKSLCYSINSSYSRFDNMFYIMTSIDKVNYKKTITEIKKIMEQSKKKLITKEDLKNKVIARNSQLDNKLAQNYNIAYYLEELDILKFDDIDTRKKQFKSITLKELIKVAEKLKLQYIYLLEGDPNEKD